MIYFLNLITSHDDRPDDIVIQWNLLSLLLVNPENLLWSTCLLLVFVLNIICWVNYQFPGMILQCFLSSPDLKGHVSFCHHFSSIVCPQFSLIFSSETTGPILTKLWWDDPFQNCIRGYNRPSNMAVITKTKKGEGFQKNHLL